MAYTSPSGPGTRLLLTLNGDGANPASMPCVSGEVQEEQAPVVPDTGFFSNSESGNVSPFLVSGTIIFAVAVLSMVALTVIRSRNRLNFAKSFRIDNPKLICKKLGIFTGFFAIAFLAISAIMPNLLKSVDSASALETDNSLAITTGSSVHGNVINMATIISDNPSMAFGSETVTVTSATSNGYSLYLSTDNDRAPHLYYNNNGSCGGYIRPTDATLSTKASLQPNQWGFAVDVNNESIIRNTAIWAGVPRYGHEVMIKQINSSTPDGSETTVSYGAWVNNQIPAGNYENTVIYTAIANLAAEAPRRMLQAVAPQSAPVEEETVEEEAEVIEEVEEISESEALEEAIEKEN